MRITISLFLILFTSLAFSSDETPVLNEEKWEELTETLDYTEEPEEAEEAEEIDDTPLSIPSGGWGGVGTIFSSARYIFMFIVGIALILLIVYMVVNGKSNPGLSARNAALQKIENIEEHIHEVDLEDLFSEFSNNGEYHIALRMSFLMIIKRLSETKLIKWEKQKTNWEYHSELRKTELRGDFGTMIQTFERLWYGEKLISEPEFHDIEEEFNSFKKHLDENA